MNSDVAHMVTLCSTIMCCKSIVVKVTLFLISPTIRLKTLVLKWLNIEDACAKFGKYEYLVNKTSFQGKSGHYIYIVTNVFPQDCL